MHMHEKSFHSNLIFVPTERQRGENRNFSAARVCVNLQNYLFVLIEKVLVADIFP